MYQKCTMNFWTICSQSYLQKFGHLIFDILLGGGQFNLFFDLLNACVKSIDFIIYLIGSRPKRIKSNLMVSAMMEQFFWFIYLDAFSRVVNFSGNVKSSRFFFSACNATKWIKFMPGLFARMSVSFCSDDSLTPTALPAYPPAFKKFPATTTM